MITIPTTARVFFCLTPTDMRKSFDGLASLVQHLLEQDPQQGHLFVFVNKRRDRIKILQFQGDGFALYYKRLEDGSIQQLPPLTDEQGNPLPCLELSSTELTLLLSGIELTAKRRKRFQKHSTV